MKLAVAALEDLVKHKEAFRGHYLAEAQNGEEVTRKALLGLAQLDDEIAELRAGIAALNKTASGQN